MTDLTEGQYEQLAARLLLRDGELLSATEAAQLLGKCGAYNAGMGQHPVLVPQRAVVDLGFDEALWKKVAQPITMKPDCGEAYGVPNGAALYELDPITGSIFVAQLEESAQKNGKM